MNFEKYINISNLKKSFKKYHNALPFNHCVVDNFFKKKIAYQLENNFPDYNDPLWHYYNNPTEIKKSCNTWNFFSDITYEIFNVLNSVSFVNFLSKQTKIKKLYSDNGLHGGGMHIHKHGGKLNPHLDYAIHPKLKLLRKINLIVYLNSNYKTSYGGSLGFWDNDKINKKPGKLLKKIHTVFNRAIFFDTSQNSWHGIPDHISYKNKEYRKSIAVYYLTNKSKKIKQERYKALYAPTKEQEKNKKILKFIKDRANIKLASKVYKT